MPRAPRLALLAVLLGVAVLAGESRSGGERGAARAAPAADRPVRVAAVGDSITWGRGIPDRERRSYPAELARLLGAGYEVRNFGVSGRTLLRRGDKPYWRTPAFEAAKAFAPDIVVITLGTNDTAPQNWQHRADFVADYRAMVDVFRALPSRPRIWVCYPVPMFGRFAARDVVLRGEVIPLIDRVARAEGVPAVDLYSVLRGRADLVPDGIHPSAEGARVIAETVARAIRAGRP